MSGFDGWQKWLVAVGCLVILFGVFMALANQTRTWVYGAWGATVAGWGVFILFIAVKPFKQQQPWAWWCLLLGLGVWYLLDSGLSWRSGVLFNVLFNTILLAAVGIPLIFTASSFLRDGSS